MNESYCMTAEQALAWLDVSVRWRGQCAPLPDNFRIVQSRLLPRGYYIGLWVGRPRNGKPGRLFLGIEKDGYTHS